MMRKAQHPRLPNIPFCPATPEARGGTARGRAHRRRVLFLPQAGSSAALPAPASASPGPAGRASSPPPELGGGSAGMAAAPGGNGPVADSRLDQETARWLQWDKVKGNRGLGPPGGGAGSSGCSPGAVLPPFVLRVPLPALPSFPPLPPRLRAGSGTQRRPSLGSGRRVADSGFVREGLSRGRSSYPAGRGRKFRGAGERAGLACTQPGSGSRPSAQRRRPRHSHRGPALRRRRYSPHPAGIVPSRPFLLLLGTLQRTRVLACKRGSSRLGLTDWRRPSQVSDFAAKLRGEPWNTGALALLFPLSDAEAKWGRGAALGRGSSGRDSLPLL